MWPKREYEAVIIKGWNEEHMASSLKVKGITGGRGDKSERHTPKDIHLA
jgi:hypothetical protein